MKKVIEKIIVDALKNCLVGKKGVKKVTVEMEPVLYINSMAEVLKDGHKMGPAFNNLEINTISFKMNESVSETILKLNIEC